MKRFVLFSIAVLFLCSSAPVATADSSVFLYVDAAPNVYGSPDYAAWQSAAFSAAAAGTFVNMAHGINPANAGTTDFEIQDEVVYSFGDLGNRLTWIYWLPGQNVEALGAQDRFQISLFNNWDGDVMDFYLDYYGSTWLEPTKWMDYDNNGDGTPDGVVGTAGMAWWGAYDDPDAPGYPKYKTPEELQAALDADLALWGLSEESWIFTARLDGVDCSITSHRDPVPEPGTLLLLGAGLLGLAGFSRKRLGK